MGHIALLPAALMAMIAVTVETMRRRTAPVAPPEEPIVDDPSPHDSHSAPGRITYVGTTLWRFAPLSTNTPPGGIVAG